MTGNFSRIIIGAESKTFTKRVLFLGVQKRTDCALKRLYAIEINDAPIKRFNYSRWNRLHSLKIPENTIKRTVS